MARWKKKESRIPPLPSVPDEECGYCWAKLISIYLANAKTPGPSASSPFDSVGSATFCTGPEGKADLQETETSRTKDNEKVSAHSNCCNINRLTLLNKSSRLFPTLPEPAIIVSFNSLLHRAFFQHQPFPAKTMNSPSLFTRRNNQYKMRPREKVGKRGGGDGFRVETNTSFYSQNCL